MTDWAGGAWSYWRLSEPPPPHSDVRQVASECDLYGHDYHVREDFSNPARWDENGRLLHDRTPDEVFCGRCGKSWKVER